MGIRESLQLLTVACCSIAALTVALAMRSTWNAYHTGIVVAGGLVAVVAWAHNSSPPGRGEHRPVDVPEQRQIVAPAVQPGPLDGMSPMERLRYADLALRVQERMANATQPLPVAAPDFGDPGAMVDVTMGVAR